MALMMPIIIFQNFQPLFLLTIESTNKYSNELIKASAQNTYFPVDSSFQVFWDEFRGAVINTDSAKLFKLTNFPLETKGNLDTDPNLYIQTDKFLEIFNWYLTQKYFDGFNLDSLITQENYLETPLVSNFEYIKTTETILECKYCCGTKSWTRMGNLEFELIGGNWMLCSIYIDSKLVQELIKE